MSTNLKETGELAKQIPWGRVSQAEGTARARVLRLEHAGMFREQQGGQGGWSGVEGHSYEGRSAKKWGPLSLTPHIRATKNYLGSLKAMLSLISCCCTSCFLYPGGTLQLLSVSLKCNATSSRRLSSIVSSCSTTDFPYINSHHQIVIV